MVQPEGRLDFFISTGYVAWYCSTYFFLNVNNAFTWSFKLNRFTTDANSPLLKTRPREDASNAVKSSREVSETTA